MKHLYKRVQFLSKGMHVAQAKFSSFATIKVRLPGSNTTAV